MKLFDYYGEYTMAQDGPFELIEYGEVLVFLRYRTELFLRVIDRDTFDKNFKEQLKNSPVGSE